VGVVAALEMAQAVVGQDDASQLKIQNKRLMNDPRQFYPEMVDVLLYLLEDFSFSISQI
jgi:hypothetical protein